ncbi:MAG: hypothetical protein LC623_09750, partial [Halobacteriales archaeon]|nr:hypothetical protein [Halobacteriales archaeon]
VFSHVYARLQPPGPFNFGDFPFNVTGRVWFWSVPGPEQALRRYLVAVEGVTGACAFEADPRCSSFPRGTTTTLRTDGVLRSLNLTATWDTPLPTMREMTLTVRCRMPDYGSCGVARSQMEVRGASPLTLAADGFGFPKGAWLEGDYVALEDVTPTAQ